MRKIYFIIVCLFLSTIVYSQALVRRLPLDTATCLSSMVLNAGNPNATYLWSSGGTTQSITVASSGNWRVTVSNSSSTVTQVCTVTFFSQPTLVLRDTTVCFGVQTIAVQSNANRFLWYSSATANQAVNTGLTNNFTSNGSYWIQPLNTIRLGSIGEITNSNKPRVEFNGNSGTPFDCSTTLIIDTVYVYAVSVPSNITIDLYKNSTLITSKTFVVTSLGKFPLPLNFEVAPGTNYNLIKATGNNKFYLGDNSSYSYPYTLSNKIKLKTYSYGLSSFSINYYSYFYDWKISEVICKSNKQPININVLASPILENPSDTIVCNSSSATLQANRLPSTQNSYTWSNGGTTNSITISNNGIYKVTISNGACAVSKSTNVQIYSPAQIISNLDTTICSGVNVVTVLSNKRAYWYKKTALAPFNFGNSYSTFFNVGTDSSWISFVDAMSFGGVGELTNRNSLPFSADKGTNFDVLADLTLDSISVYAVNNNSTIEIELYKDNTLLKSKVFSLLNSGLNKLAIDWEISMGSNYKLMKKSDANLFNLGNNGVTYNYPYQIANVISLNGYQNGLGSFTTQYYSYFFDWRIIQKKCQSPKQLFKVNVLATPPPP